MLKPVVLLKIFVETVLQFFHDSFDQLMHTCLIQLLISLKKKSLTDPRPLNSSVDGT